MTDKRSEFASIIRRANTHAFNTVLELDYSKRSKLEAFYNELGEKTLELFFPLDLAPVQPAQWSRPSDKPKKSKGAK